MAPPVSTSPLESLSTASLMPSDQTRAEWTIEELEATSHSTDGANPALSKLLKDDRAKALLAALAGNSPFLARLLVREADVLPSLLTEQASQSLDTLLQACRAEMEAA